MAAPLDIEPDPVALRGGVLRAWREHAGVSGAALARALPAQRSTVSMWEADGRARRAATVRTVREIGRCLGLDPRQTTTLADLWRAASSVADGMPRRDWSFNFDGPSGPAWLWLRSAPTQSTPCASRADLWWGEPFQARVDVEGSPGGVVVTLPTTLRNPALDVRLARPGWADVGHGSIPAGVAGRLGIRVVDGASLLEPAPPATGRPDGGPTPLPSGYAGLLRRIFDDCGIAWRVLRPHVQAAHAAAGVPPTIDASDASCHGGRSADLQTRLSMPGAQVSRARRARGRSRQSVADQANRLDPTNPLTAKAIELLEATGRVPPITGLLARVDLALGLDGRLGVERTFDSRESSLGHARTRYLVPFLPYWVGPVWLCADGPGNGAPGVVDLRWGPWHRRQTVRPGVVLHFRRAPSATAPLEAVVPAGWRVTAGIGRWPDALDINRDWRPADMPAAIRLLCAALADIRAGQAGSLH